MEKHHTMITQESQGALRVYSIAPVVPVQRLNELW